MRQWLARLLPVSRRGRNPDPETAAGGAVGSRAGTDAAAGRLRPHHRLRRLHAAAGLHQRDSDQPDLEPRLYPDTAQPGLAKNSLVGRPGFAGTTAVVRAYSHYDFVQLLAGM